MLAGEVNSGAAVLCFLIDSRCMQYSSMLLLAFGGEEPGLAG